MNTERRTIDDTGPDLDEALQNISIENIGDDEMKVIRDTHRILRDGSVEDDEDSS